MDFNLFNAIRSWIEQYFFKKGDHATASRGTQDGYLPTATGADGKLSATFLGGIATFAGLFIDGVLRVRQAGATRYRSDHAVTLATTTLNSYDDTGGVYLPIVIDGSTIALRPSADISKALLVDASGNVTIVGSATASSAVTATGVNAGFVLYNRATNVASMQFYSPVAGELRLYDHPAGADRVVVSVDGLQALLPVSETARGADNVRIGVVGGTPRIVLEDSGSTQWEIDNSAGSLRFFNPGVIKATLDTSGNLVLTGTIKTAAGFAWNLFGYTAGAPVATGHVDITINGTTYQLLAKL